MAKNKFGGITKEWIRTAFARHVREIRRQVAQLEKSATASSGTEEQHSI